MYSLKERLIYPYYDGRRDRWGDPLAIEDAYTFALAMVDMASLGEQLRSPIREIKIAASAQFLPAIRRAFGVVELSEETGEGLPLAETYDLGRKLFAWKDATRIEYRALAQHVATYGHDPTRPIDYLAFCGLQYNLERVAAIQAVQVARGIVSALTGKPHPSLVDAMAESESRIPWVQLMVDQESIEAEQAAKIASGKPF
jgi:hypothetical protein